MDYYSTLGVSKNANEKEIRKAYKTKSMQHHPDRGGDEEEFKKINEAYSTLKDPQKKAMYDQYGSTNPQQQGFHSQGFNAQNMEDIFGSFFGQGFQQNPRRQRMQNADVTIQCDITLEEVYNGKGVIATFKTRSGREQTVNIDIPKGSRQGDTIRYQGLGDDSLPGIPKGNLNVRIRILNHPKYRTDGFNLHTEVKINVFDLMLGTATTLDIPNGKAISINIPQGTQPGTVMSVNGQGLPDYNTGRSGNIYLHIQGEIPRDLTQDKLELIRKLK